ncbi:MAG: hypothetical protein QXL34_07275 [Thermosphaera sp.]
MKLSVAVAAVLISGCASFDPWIVQARGQVSQAYDRGLESAERFVCNDASVGAIIRRYGVSADRARTWKEFCFGNNALDVATER